MLYLIFPCYCSVAKSCPTLCDLMDCSTPGFSFRIGCFDVPAVQGTSKSLLQQHSSKALILLCWASFMVQLSHPSVQFSRSVISLCNPMDCSTPGFPVHHQPPDLTQIHVHQVDDAIQPSHPLSAPSPLAFNLSQHQGLFQWVSSSHQVAKILEFQLQHQSFQWIFRTDLP